MSSYDRSVEPDELDPQGRIGEALDGILDKATLNVLLKEVLAITKQARGWCSNCKRARQRSNAASECKT
jgi:hypothetical protein